MPSVGTDHYSFELRSAVLLTGNKRKRITDAWISNISNDINHSMFYGLFQVRDLNGLLSQPGNAKQHQTTMSFGIVLLHRGNSPSNLKEIHGNFGLNAILPKTSQN